MNTFKKTGGFTLVELIIVIAILAILSSVAVAGYSSYIKTANDSATESFLNDLKTHVALANAKGGAVTEIKVTAAGVVTVKVASIAPDFKENLEDAYKAYLKVTNGNTDINTATAGQITFTLESLPTAWDNSSYETVGATWSNNEWNPTTDNT